MSGDELEPEDRTWWAGYNQGARDLAEIVRRDLGVDVSAIVEGLTGIFPDRPASEVRQHPADFGDAGRSAA